ncbi:unnamed protein product [Nesidiocoris tenuis]|uniref:Peroxisome assembly protein n=2 Tax=Nesidiocoris tenuis TaxID=355587 RepID=A0ABN7A6Q9_9HEMI|nr:Peroxisome assembly protein [Nesidiocoris tenuis]CAB0002361.1 unnamed protein product [Nesidiocoris tenuis]
MAENAVFISSIEHSKPTIFEIWAEESFKSTLQQAFQLLCDFVRSKLPDETLGRSKVLRLFFENPDESFLIFNFLMQYTYLDWFSASFSESFYGMQRVNAKNPTERMNAKAKILSMLGLVGVPYLSVKIKAIIDRYVFATGQRQDTGVKLLQYYRVLSFSLRIVELYHYVSYLGGVAPYHSVLHRIAGVRLVHQNQPTPTWSDIYNLFSLEPRKSKLLGPLAFKVVSQSFEIGAFCLQFINWWNSSDSEALKFNRTPIPEVVESIDSGNVCPICLGPWKNEVALGTSGIVYCYSCILKAHSVTGKCPVTNLPFTMDDLIRLYPSAS